MQLGPSRQAPQETPETPGIHRDHPEAPPHKTCFPAAFFSGEGLPSFGEYKDKPLLNRVDGYTTRVFGFGVWETASEVCDVSAMTPMKVLKALSKVIIVLSIIIGLVNWRMSVNKISAQNSLARDLAVLHPSYKGPVFLHVLSYPHAGSEYIGKIFDLYQDSFYVHDPLELVYTSVYGITPNSDRILANNILFNVDGSSR
jgi:hypothetical protein